MSHVVILPYFCDEEVDRYLKIVNRLAEFPRQQCEWQFLLAASPRIECSDRLREACERVAPTQSFQCPTQVFGYPQGPTAMFWDAMNYIEQHSEDDGGFGLWLESDMVPVKPNWLDRLDEEWDASGPPLLMGCYVPEVYKQRLLRRRKLLLEDHVNGGACYAKHFSRWMPSEAREGVFDVVVYKLAKKLGRVKATGLIDFSTNERARRDVLDPDKVLLHGFMQDKDKFIDDCIAPVTDWERRNAFLQPLMDSWETTRRRMRVWAVRRGQQAMYENMLLAKRRDNTRRAA
ncbi:MAG: hypothetical protein ACR2NP_22775 [Pirellulaceae bacterium]